MAWRTVVISQHAKVSVRSHNLVIQTDTRVDQLPVEDIQVLMLASMQVSISAPAVVELVENDSVIIYTGRDGQPIAETRNNHPSARSASLLRGQTRWDTMRQQLLWTKIVRWKVCQQLTLLADMELPVEDLDAQLKQVTFNDTTNREAKVAHDYFPRLFGKNFTRTDDSVVNAVLNYGYSILLSFTNRAIVSNGYSTYLGIHHDNEQNEFNLGSDLMEPFRPIVDRWTAQHRFRDLTPDVKYDLIGLMNLEVTCDNHQALVCNVINDYVRDCLKYLDGQTASVELEMKVPHEVSSHAINDHV